MIRLRTISPNKRADSIDMDELTLLFSKFTPNAKLVFSGNLCQNSYFSESSGVGFIHLLLSGSISVVRNKGKTLIVDQPSIIFYPRPCNHDLLPMNEDEMELLCASVDLGGGAGNPLNVALPDELIVPLSELPGISTTMRLMFNEALSQHCGSEIAVNRLLEFFLVLLFRHLINSNNIKSGLLAGLGDPRLRKAIAAIHEKPEFPWSLEDLADEATMSRARFASRFKAIVNKTPMDYLTEWRISVAQTLLLKGKSIKAVSLAVGYQSPTALSRVFEKKQGVTPRGWLKQQQL